MPKAIIAADVTGQQGLLYSCDGGSHRKQPVTRTKSVLLQCSTSRRRRCGVPNRDTGAVNGWGGYKYTLLLFPCTRCVFASLLHE